LFRFEFADEPFISIFTVLGLLGLMLKIARREYLLPAWLLVLHTFEPRGGALFIMIPLSMGAGFALVEMVLKNLQEASSRPSEAFPTGQAGAEQWLPTLMQNQATRWLVGFLVVYGSMAAFFTAWRVQQQFTLTKDDLSSFNWVLDNTSPAAQFALVTQGLPLRDASSEWFPSLTRRRSLATVFGLEWIPDADFAEALTKYRTLQACAQQGSPCLETWIGQHSADLDYVYIRDPIDVGRLALSRSLADAPDYSRVYVSNTVVVYKRR
jgi:hypothetical protein